MPQNIGEENEILLKAFLTKCYRCNLPLEGGPESIRKISDLMFGPLEQCPSWDDAYEVYLINKNVEKLKLIFPKAGSSYKADLQINKTRYSTKCSQGANPAILNHTHRKGMLKVCGRINTSIKTLDEMVEEYWKLRLAGKIGEDINSIDPRCPFSNKDYLKPIIEYFLFKGTGSRDSEFPADKLLSYSDPFNPETYKIYSADEIINELWDSFIISIRSKGMPSVLYLDIHKEYMPWVRKVNGKLKGSLHIRTPS